MHDPTSNGTHIKANICVEIGSRNSENDHDAPITKNYDDEVNINKLTIPRAINLPFTTYSKGSYYFCQSTFNMVVNYVASSNFQWKNFSCFQTVTKYTQTNGNK